MPLIFDPRWGIFAQQFYVSWSLCHFGELELRDSRWMPVCHRPETLGVNEVQNIALFFSVKVPTERRCVSHVLSFS